MNRRDALKAVTLTALMPVMAASAAKEKKQDCPSVHYRLHYPGCENREWVLICTYDFSTFNLGPEKRNMTLGLFCDRRYFEGRDPVMLRDLARGWLEETDKVQRIG